MNPPAHDLRIETIDDEAFVGHVHASGQSVPIEQAPVWDAYDAAVSVRTPWRRLVARDAAADAGAAPIAVIALTKYEGHGFEFLWAKHGPVWLTEPSAALEKLAHRALSAYVEAEAPEAVFVRLHARHQAGHLSPLLQTVTYDRTVVIDLAPDADSYLAGLAKKFRYTVRQALKHEAVAVTDESTMTTEQFGELYAIYLETADRDGFGIYSADAYFEMIQTLAPHARVFVARRTDTGDDGAEPGRATAWAIITLYDGHAQYYYAAGNAEARATDATVRLLWDALAQLRSEGARTFDMMGVDSPLAPTLAGVGLFKRKWGAESAVDSSWDLPIKRAKYRGLRIALRLKKLFGR